MNIFTKREFYINSILTFIVFVLIDWFIASGFKLFKGNSISQTIENYKIPYTYIILAMGVVYFNLKKVKGNLEDTKDL